MTVAELVDRERARVARLTLLAGAAAGCAALAVVVAIMLAGLGDARWIASSAALPFLGWAVALGVVAGIATRTARTIRREATRDAIARRIEGERALRRGAVRGALEVDGAPGALARQGAADVLARLGRPSPRGASLLPLTARRLRRRAAIVASAAVAALVVCVALSHRAPDAWAVVLHPVRAWRGTLLAPLVIDAPTEALRGDRPTDRVVAPGRRRVALATRAPGAEWVTTWHAVDASGAVRITVGPLDGDLTLVAADGRAVSDTTTMHVAERPYVGGIALRAVYPAYLGRASEPLAAGEVARVPRGTRVEITGHASTALGSVRLARDGDATALAVDGQRFRGELAAVRSGHWDWEARRADGAPIADLPTAVELDVIPDSAPTVTIVAPDKDTVVAAVDRVVLALAASDDHGLASVALRTWRQPAGGGVPRQPEIVQRVVGDTGAQWRGDAVLDLSIRALQPGDALHVVAVATDRSPWRQTGESRELVLRVPSMDEQRTLARTAGDSTASAASQVAQAERALEQRTEDAARARGQRTAAPRGGQETAAGASGQSSSLSFESAERARALGAAQRQLGDRVQALERQAAQLEKQLQQAGSLDSGLAAELHEAQQLLRDALTPELQAQLGKLDQGAQALRPSDERQTLGDLARQQQRARDQLDRSVEVLKRAALEGAMQTLRDQAQDLAHRDSAAASAAERHTESPAQSQADAAQLAAQSRALSRQIDSLAHRLAREKAETGAQKVSAAAPHADSSTDALQRMARQSSQPAPPRPPGPPRRTPSASDSQQVAGGASSPPRGASPFDTTAPPPPPSGARTASQPDRPRCAPTDTVRSRHPGRDGSPDTTVVTYIYPPRCAVTPQTQGRDAADPQRAGQQMAQQSRGQPGGQPGDQPGQQPGSQPGAQQGAPPGGAQDASAPPSASQSASQSAAQAASQMGEAAQQLADARSAQVSEWKAGVTAELDRSIQESLQMARQENDLAQRAQQGANAGDLKAEQSAIQQGMEQAAQRLQRAGRQSALVSSGSQQAMGEARTRVGDASTQLQQAQSMNPGGGGGAQAASAMQDAAAALNQAAAALVRDREHANSAGSASGLAELMQQMRQLAQQQGALNAQAQGLSMSPGSTPGDGQARALADEQRQLARALDDAAGADASGRAGAMAREAHEIAAAMARGGPDPSTLARQQRLYHRLLDAGRTLEQDERDSSGKREAQAATARPGFTPGDAPVDGARATRFREPTWADLRGLRPEERQLVIDYFKRINAASP